MSDWFPHFRPAALLVLSLGAVLGLRAEDWHEIRSPHFVVYTDAGQKHGREVALRFEKMRNLFEKLLSTERVSSAVPLEIIVFRNTGEFEENISSERFKPKPGIAGVFYTHPDTNFVLIDGSKDTGFPIAFHEYAHTILHANFTNIPLWFDEGFADYYANTKMLYGQVELGDSPKYANAFFRGRALMPVVDLFAVTHSSDIYTEHKFKTAMFYGESWLMVHYLFDKQKMAGFAKYVDLTTSQHMPIPQAIQLAFGMAPKQIDSDLAAYRTMGTRQIFRAPETEKDDPNSYAAVQLDPDAAPAILSNFRFHMDLERDKAMEELTAIVTKNPSQRNAILGLGFAELSKKEYKLAELQLNRLLSTDKKNARAHFLYGQTQLALALDSEDQQELLISAWDHLKTAVRLDPGVAEAHSLLGSVYARLHDRQGAISEAKTAASLDQSNQHYFVNLGQLLLDEKSYSAAAAIYNQLSYSADPNISVIAKQKIEEIKQTQSDTSKQGTSSSSGVQPGANPERP
jgi:Flp pilus assembly protein TadD